MHNWISYFEFHLGLKLFASNEISDDDNNVLCVSSSQESNWKLKWFLLFVSRFAIVLSVCLRFVSFWNLVKPLDLISVSYVTEWTTGRVLGLFLSVFLFLSILENVCTRFWIITTWTTSNRYVATNFVHHIRMHESDGQRTLKNEGN